MMNRKGLTVVLREVFAFAFGIFILISVTSMFNGVIVPSIKKFSYNEQLLGLIEQVNSMVIRVDDIIRDGVNTTFMIKGELPSKVGVSSYRVYVEGNLLCARTSSDYIVTRCINYTTSSVLSGNYLGGTEMKITGVNNPDTGSVITFENYL